MKVALTIPYLPPSIFGRATQKIYGDVSVGGAETWGWDFARAIRGMGFEVDIFTADVPAIGRGWTIVDGIQVYRASVESFVDIVPILGADYASALREKRYDLYQHSLFAHRSFCEMVEISKQCNASSIFSHHGCGIITPDPLDRHRIMTALSSVDLITAPSLSSLEHYDSTWIRRKIAVLPNGVDNQRFKPDAWRAHAATREAFRQVAFGSDERPTVLFVGRLLPHKGILFLLEALAIVHRERSGLRPRLVLCGTGDQRRELEAFCAECGLGVGNDVIFAGFVPDAQLPAFYSAADVLVLPSTRKGYHGETFIEPEAFGLVLTEAMACGLPCIATAIPGVQSVVRHGTNGLLVDEGSSRAIAGALVELFTNEKKRDVLRLGGLYTAKNTFAYDRIATKFGIAVEQLSSLNERRERHVAPRIEQEKRRLIFIAPSTTQFYSGQGRHLFEVSRILVDHYKIEIVTDDFVYANLRSLFDFADAHDVEVTVLKGMSPNGTLDPEIPDLRSHLASRSDDSIICPIGWANTFTIEAVLAERRNRIVAFIPHFQPTETVPFAEGELRLRLDTQLELILGTADVVVTISTEEAALLQSRCKGDVVVSLHGVDPYLFRDTTQFKEPIALFVGDLKEPRKRLSLTIDVFRKIRERIAGLKLFVIGRCDNPEELRSQLPTDVQDAIVLVGYVSDEQLADYYSRASLFINTASYEAFCIPLIESMACGAIPLATRTGGVPSVIDDGVTGFLLDPDDPCSDIERILPRLCNSEQVDQLRLEARLAAHRDFRWSTSADVFKRALDSATARREFDGPAVAVGAKLKVLVINDYFAPDLVGGAEVYLKHLEKAVSDRVDLTIARYGERARDTHVGSSRILYMPYNRGSGFQVDPSQFDVVHVNSVHRLDEEHYLRLPPERTIVDMHDYWGICPNNELVWFPDLPKLTRCDRVFDAKAPSDCLACQGDVALERMRKRDRLLGRAARIMCHSGFVEEKLKRRFPTMPIDVIPYGVWPEEFKDIERRSHDRGPFRVLFVGRISLTKGVTLFGEIVERLAAQIPNFELLIAGNFTSYWDWYSDFRREMQHKKLERYVRFLGHVPLENTAFLYGLADVSIIPSLWDEPFGIVTIESLAAGCPVVASPHGGLGRIFENETHSLYVSEPTAEQFVDAIMRLYGDRSLSTRLSGNGRSLVSEQYTVELMATRIFSVYERFTATPP